MINYKKILQSFIVALFLATSYELLGWKLEVEDANYVSLIAYISTVISFTTIIYICFNKKYTFYDGVFISIVLVVFLLLFWVIIGFVFLKAFNINLLQIKYDLNIMDIIIQ
ncbi:MAG: hypothetical protein KAX49_19555 [Halanaerobiales bacterium]|nr:hypothetical protein [Halanaerobiales bacterium]